MNKIEFKRVVRECPHNEKVQSAEKAGRLLIDWDVHINGERRATWKASLVERRYVLTIQSGEFYQPITKPSASGSYETAVEVKTKSDFAPTIEKLLADGRIPTIEQIEKLKADKIRKERERKQAAEELAQAEARQARWIASEKEFIDAAKNAIDVMHNMRQGRFVGACSRLQKLIDRIEGKA